jgi:hypothetical protein
VGIDMPKLLFARPPLDAVEERTIRKLAGARHVPARVPQFVGSRGLQIRVLSCGDAYWRVFRACHYTLRWPE